MLKINKKQIVIIIVIIVLILGVIYYYYANNNQKEIQEEIGYLEDEIISQNEEKNIQMIENTQQIVIHVTGEVINPGIVRLKENSRIIDAIEAAGGATNEADLEKINLAYMLEDGEKIYVPNINDEETNETISVENNKTSNNQAKTKVNINTATLEQLMTLPGVGESTAQKIITYRQQNGKFNKIEDIKSVSGIGESKFSKIEQYISIK